MRKLICDILRKKYPISAISIKSDKVIRPYLVVKIAESRRSTTNSLCAFFYFEVLVYVPNNSISPIDNVVKDVIDMLKDTAEFTGRVTYDFYDDVVGAYMRTIEFRIPVANF